jgi:hypothetical protein
MADADIIGLMQQAPAGMSMAPGGAPADAQPPMPSPMTTPEPKTGQRENALVNLSMAMDLIEQSLPALGSESPEGQKAISALTALTSVLGPKKQKAQDLQQAEILQLLQNLPQAGGGSLAAKQLGAAGPNLGTMTPPPPAAAPAGAPPMPPGMPPGGASMPA